MKKLSYFQKFDFAKWQDGKKFVIQSARFNEKKGCVSLDVIIIEDKTDYGDLHISNLYEKFKVHCLKDTEEEHVEKYNPNTEIKFLRVGKCSVWGDYASNLSIEAEVEVIS